MVALVGKLGGVKLTKKPAKLQGFFISKRYRFSAKKSLILRLN